MKDNWQTLVRSFLKIGTGCLLAKGTIDESQAEVIISAVIGLATVIWGIVEKNKLKSAAKAPVVVASSEDRTTVTESSLP